MIKNNWVYPVICLASLNALLLGQAPLFFSCLLIVCLLRLWCLRQPAVLMVSGLVLCLGGCRFWLARRTYEQPVRPNNQVYKIQPDTIKVAGDQIQLTCCLLLSLPEFSGKTPLANDESAVIISG